MTEKKELLSVDEKRLTRRGQYSKALDLNKEALVKGWELECEETGMFRRLSDFLGQKWTIETWKVSGGFEIHMAPLEEEKHGENK